MADARYDGPAIPYFGLGLSRPRSTRRGYKMSKEEARERARAYNRQPHVKLRQKLKRDREAQILIQAGARRPRKTFQGIGPVQRRTVRRMGYSNIGQLMGSSLSGGKWYGARTNEGVTGRSVGFQEV